MLVKDVLMVARKIKLESSQVSIVVDNTNITEWQGNLTVKEIYVHGLELVVKVEKYIDTSVYNLLSAIIIANKKTIVHSYDGVTYRLNNTDNIDIMLDVDLLTNNYTYYESNEYVIIHLY